MADGDPPDSMVLKPGDKLYEYRTKANLAAKIGNEFIRSGNGEGVAACMAVLIQVATSATNSGVSPRTRARAAEAFLSLAVKASDHGVKVAIQTGGAEPDVQAGGPPRDRGFWQAALSDTEARKTTLHALSAALGVPPPVKATVSAETMKSKPIDPAPSPTAKATAAVPVVRATVARKASP